MCSYSAGAPGAPRLKASTGALQSNSGKSRAGGSSSRAPDGATRTSSSFPNLKTVFSGDLGLTPGRRWGGDPWLWNPLKAHPLRRASTRAPVSITVLKKVDFGLGFVGGGWGCVSPPFPLLSGEAACKERG